MPPVAYTPTDMDPLDRLRELRLELPPAPAALAAYVPVRAVPIGQARSLLFIAGQVPVRDGKPLYTGRVPSEVTLEQAADAARVCALNVLAQVHRETGLEKVEQVLQLTVFVLSEDGFAEQPKVANAASELLAEVLGDAGQHARVAVGVNALPLRVPVEIAAIVVARAG